MFKRTAVLLTLIISSLLPIAVITTMAAPTKTTTQTPLNASVHTPVTDTLAPTGTGIAVSRRSDDALINTDLLMLYGPDICTSWGDPFSPLTPTWAATSWLDPLDFQGVYTYQFRIRIPADYPDDIVRVELFDPDSINQAENIANIIHSQTAQLIDPGQFPSTPVEMTCSGSPSSQKSACAISTGEASLVGSNGITVDHINPLWFVRVDENRGVGTSACANAPTYTPETNTQTRYTLSYFALAENGSSNQVLLASYNGQTADGIRDNGDHDTDLRWVSPGASQSPDQPVFVPAEQGDFEVDLNQDVPNLSVDPLTGERFLYLDVTTLSGGSLNGFAVWAGPDDYVSAVPSDVNIRDLYILGNPGSHYNQGVKVEALNYLPRLSLSSIVADYPLVELGPEYAGQTITVSLFDADAGSKPPVLFFMDSLAFTPDPADPDGIDETQTDWGVSFGGAVDPLGRCFDGGSAYNGDCNNAWIDPVYTITLPSEQQCDYANPTPETCTPFYGGQLWTKFKGGTLDAHAWHVSVPERPLFDNTLGCSAFPIGVYQNIRSVTPTGWSNYFFDYPTPSPNYYNYVNHLPDMPLDSAYPGYLYSLQVNPGFLAWNTCATSASDLTDSMTWPGNSKDYTPRGGTCPATGESPVPGYIEVGDPTDKEMNIGDWIALSNGSLSSASLRDTLEDHIDLDRILRLPIYDEQENRDGYAAVRASRFGLFRLVGYGGLDQGGSGPFIMVEFIKWNDSCSQEPTYINNVTLSGPTSGFVDTSYIFTATVSPIDVTPPINIVWSATDSAAFTETNQLNSTHTFQWTASGPKTITVTAQNEGSAPVTVTHQITIFTPMDLVIGPLELVSTPPITAGQSVMFRTTITNTGEIDLNSQFFVDVFINPTEIYTEYIPLTESNGYAAVSSLAAETSRVVTITAPFGFPADIVSHTVYAMVDSLRQVAEADETNNISQPLTTTTVLPPSPFITVIPSCSSTPHVGLTILGANWPDDEDIVLYFDGNLRATILAGHGGSFSMAWEETVTVGEDYEITAVSTSHSASDTLTTPCQPAGPEQVIISGPLVGRIGEPLTFVATVAPVTAVQPLTYTWYISETSQITHTNGLTDTLTFTWDTLGSQGFSLSVVNEYGFARTRFLFEIVEQQIFLPVIMKTEE